jgi:glycosyltransferase involved in cell wall biosynthesis
MRVAIIHDELMRRGGAEQVVLTMLKAFPGADIYTLGYNSEGTYPEFKEYKDKIHTSVFQVFAKSVKLMQKFYFPFGIMAMKNMKVYNYDVILVSNTHCAKYVQFDPRALVFIYTYTPFRLAWNPTSYTQYVSAKGVFKLIFDNVIHILKQIDSKAAKRGNYFLGMTTETAQRIREAYKVDDVKIIRPDVKMRNFHVSDNEKDYYLVVSRLEHYKRVDLAIEAFNQLGLKLIVVGSGTKAEELKSIANKNIEFKSGMSLQQLAELYANCKALIFPQYEDYGITPLEANASGRPVIAYEKGGVIETMIPYSGKADECTAVFFKEQTPKSLVAAVLQSEEIEFNPAFIRAHAEKFDETHFVTQITNFVNEKYKESKLTQYDV